MTQPNPAPVTSAAPPTTPPAAPAAPAAPGTTPSLSGPESWPEEARRKVAELNAENASWRTKLREAEPLAAKARELEEAQKTAEQRAAEAQAAAEKRAADAELKLLRAEVAAEKGLTAAQAKRLVGSTREELLADADDFLTSLPAAPTTTATPGTRTPVEALRPGALPNPPAPSLDDQIAEAEKAGRWRDVLTLQNQKLDTVK